MSYVAQNPKLCLVSHTAARVIGLSTLRGIAPTVVAEVTTLKMLFSRASFCCCSAKHRAAASPVHAEYQAALRATPDRENGAELFTQCAAATVVEVRAFRTAEHHASPISIFM